MKALSGFKKSLGIALWFMFLTFPIVVIRVNTIEKVVEWRWRNMAFVGIGSFLLSFLWRWLLARKEQGRKRHRGGQCGESRSIGRRLLAEPRINRPALAALALLSLAFPFLFSSYQTNIMTTALIYVMLGLGLNIVVGLAGLLDLGYVAFYAVGAYSYALLNHHFGLGFWAALPVGALLAALFGISSSASRCCACGGTTWPSSPWASARSSGSSSRTGTPSPSAPAASPTSPGRASSACASRCSEATVYLYYHHDRPRASSPSSSSTGCSDSRIGRAWIALREDEIACEAMGIDKTKTKLTAFALGADLGGHGRRHLRRQDHLHQPGELHLPGVGHDPVDRRPGRHGLDRGRDPRGLPPDPAAGVPAGLQPVPDAPVRHDDGPDDGLPAAGDRGRTCGAPTDSETGRKEERPRA